MRGGGVRRAGRGSAFAHRHVPQRVGNIIAGNMQQDQRRTIEVEQAGALVVPAKPVLRALAQRLNLSLLNANGNPYNTRQLGSQVITTIQELKLTEPTTDR